MGLFVFERFISASGQELDWKIECDALTDDDWEAIAAKVGPKFSFDRVEGVPRGGLRFAEALEPYAIGFGLLIVDDVLTTGGSMTIQRNGRAADGLVLFSRGPLLGWIKPIFEVASWL